jgi:hypothetical protein
MATKRLTDTGIANLTFAPGTRREILDTIVPGLAIRIGARRKTFVAMVRARGWAGRVTLAFGLSGDGDEKYALRSASGDWEVYYCERGSERNLRAFCVVEQALQHVLTLLTTVPSTRLCRYEQELLLGDGLPKRSTRFVT